MPDPRTADVLTVSVNRGDALDGIIGNHHSKFGTIDARIKPSYGSGYAINAGTVAWRKSSTDIGTRPVRFVTVVVTIA